MLITEGVRLGILSHVFLSNYFVEPVIVMNKEGVLLGILSHVPRLR
jgi:hypothetical protein